MSEQYGKGFEGLYLFVQSCDKGRNGDAAQLYQDLVLSTIN